MINHVPLLLASSSTYRRELLARLRCPFTCVSPDIDESPRPGESPRALALRLAIDKANAGAKLAPAPTGERLVIGSDQVATLDGHEPLGKPGNHARAVAQLKASSGRQVDFHTAVCLLRCSDGAHFTEVVDIKVHFRELSDEIIQTYLLAEQPYDCAGSAKSEGLGIVLVKSITGPDSTALVGLPLIALTGLMASAGYPLLAQGTGS